MLQFVSDTQPSSSATAEAQDYAIGSHMRVFQYVLQRLGGEPGEAADISQHSWPGTVLSKN